MAPSHEGEIRPPALLATSMQYTERHGDAGMGGGACLPDCSLKAGVCRVPVMLHSALAIHHKGVRDARDMSCCHEHLPCAPVWVHDHLQQRQGTPSVVMMSLPIRASHAPVMGGVPCASGAEFHHIVQPCHAALRL